MQSGSFSNAESRMKRPAESGGGAAWSRAVDIVRRLRSEHGCPWDREQTLVSLKAAFVEECCELLDAIESGDATGHLEELGDVLLHILLQARIREEEGVFSMDDVPAALAEKLIRRHPHVFAGASAADSAEVLKRWDRIKAEEKGERKNWHDGVPASLSALVRAHKLQARASKLGFDWSKVGEVFAKVNEEIEEVRRAVESGSSLRVREEAGDLLFAVVNLCRFLGVNGEDALHAATAKFVERLSAVEERLRARGMKISDCGSEELDKEWEAVKRSPKAERLGC